MCSTDESAVFILLTCLTDEEPASGREPQQLGDDRGGGGASHYAHAHRLAQRHAQRSREQERCS